MKLYCGIDLHSNNSVVVILDEADKVVYRKTLDNNLTLILQQLSVYPNKIVAIAIESTFNWYWLIDGLNMQTIIISCWYMARLGFTGLIMLSADVFDNCIFSKCMCHYRFQNS